MKRIYITFAGSSAYDHTTEWITSRGPTFGAAVVYVYDEPWLKEQDFYRLNEWLWHTPGMKGFGYWCWKPFIIMHALENFCDPGDVVLFTDADTYPIADLRPLYDRCVEDGGAMLFAAQGCSNRQWVKADCWTVTAANVDVPGRRSVMYDSQHAVARFMLFQKGPWHVKQFLMEWLTYCLNPLATTFAKSTLLGEYQGFEEHRTEQAILSLLAHKYGHHLYREACQFGNGALAEGVDSWLPQTFVQQYAGAKTTEGSRYRNV